MKKHYVIVEHRQSDAFLRQKQRIAELQKQLDELKLRYYQLEALYGSEIQYNNALCDLCRSHSIPFRPVFEHSTRQR